MRSIATTPVAEYLVRPKMKCFSAPEYFVPLPSGHVFPMQKFPDSAAAVASRSLGTVIDPGVIADVDLYRVHTQKYVTAIRTGDLDPITRTRLGLPWSPQLSTRSHRAVAGTLLAARSALRDGIACNLAGGTHHAFSERGEGFCVFNDVAIAIRALQFDEPYVQAMVIDLDAHQGNGTHSIFAGDPNVFTYSVHVGRNYPSVKVQGSMDVELSRWAGADEYFTRLTETLPNALEQFEPDIVFYIAGVDVHVDDRFGQMRLGTNDMRHRDEWTLDLCRRSTVPTVVLYGGGYNKGEGMTTALHVQTIEVASERFRLENVSRGLVA